MLNLYAVIQFMRIKFIVIVIVIKFKISSLLPLQVTKLGKIDSEVVDENMFITNDARHPLRLLRLLLPLNYLKDL